MAHDTIQTPPGGSRYLPAGELRRLRNLLFVARAIVEGHYAGRHRSRSRGHTVEFADYREYCAGDDVAEIDWKAYGRTDRLFVRLFEAQTDMVVHALLDCSASMGYDGFARDAGRSRADGTLGEDDAPAGRRFVARGVSPWTGSPPPAQAPEGRQVIFRPAGACDDAKRHTRGLRRRLRTSGHLRAGARSAASLSKLEYAKCLLAALAFLTVRQGDKVGLGLFREGLDEYVRPGGTFGHLYELLHRIEPAAPSGKTDIAAALRQAFAVTRPRGLLVVISDFLGDPDELFDALAMYRHRKFEVVLLQVLHEDEVCLPSGPGTRFVDSETGESLTAAPGDVAEAYEARLRAHLSALRTGCAARRIDYSLITTGMDHVSALRAYLAGRRGA